MPTRGKLSTPNHGTGHKRSSNFRQTLKAALLTIVGATSMYTTTAAPKKELWNSIHAMHPYFLEHGILWQNTQWSTFLKMLPDSGTNIVPYAIYREKLMHEIRELEKDTSINARNISYLLKQSLVIFDKFGWVEPFSEELNAALLKIFSTNPEGDSLYVNFQNARSEIGGYIIFSENTKKIRFIPIEDNTNKKISELIESLSTDKDKDNAIDNIISSSYYQFVWYIIEEYEEVALWMISPDNTDWSNDYEAIVKNVKSIFNLFRPFKPDNIIHTLQNFENLSPGQKQLFIELLSSNNYSNKISDLKTFNNILLQKWEYIVAEYHVHPAYDCPLTGEYLPEDIKHFLNSLKPFSGPLTDELVTDEQIAICFPQVVFKIRFNTTTKKDVFDIVIIAATIRDNFWR